MITLPLERRVRGSNRYPAGRKFQTVGYAYIDDVDKDLSVYRWGLTIRRRKNGTDVRYAIRSIGAFSEKLYLHRIIGLRMGFHPSQDVDHINSDGLMCCRWNLRPVNDAQNQANSRKRIGSSIFKGVSRHRMSGRWQAQISKSGKPVHLGLADTEEGAARLYDSAARATFGKYALLNFPD